MKIKIEIELPIEVVGNDVIIKSHEALNKLFGSSATAGSCHIFGIEKLPHNTWKVPLSKLRERYKDLLQKVDDMQQKTLIMKQILEGIDEKPKSVVSEIVEEYGTHMCNPIKKKEKKYKMIKVTMPKDNANKSWSKKELDIIKNNPNMLGTELVKLLPGRTLSALYHKTTMMKKNLLKQKQDKISKGTGRGTGVGWTEEDENTLLNNLDKTNLELMKLMSVKRTENAISVRKSIVMKRNEVKPDPNLRKRVIDEKRLTKSYGAMWRDSELEIIRNNVEKTPKQLMKFLPGRTNSAIKQARHKILRARVSEINPVSLSERKEMYKEILDVVKDEKEKIQNLIDLTQDKELKFTMVENVKFVIETMRHNLIGKGKLEYKDVAWIKLHYNFEKWTESLWNTFIDEFMTQSNQIAEFFGVENKFAMDNDGLYKRIIYRLEE